MTDNIEPVPEIAAAIETARDKRRMSAGIDMMITRVTDFASPLQAQLAGMAAIPESRKLLDDAMTERWSDVPGNQFGSRDKDFSDREVIIGSGFTAACYAAARVRMGKPKPVVLDSAKPEYIGGAFAVSPEPVFELNSGNRGGTIGLPGDNQAALNYLPGGILQPSQLPGGDHQTNAEMRLVIRLALAQFAVVSPEAVVTAASGTTLEVNGREYTFKRVIDARGLGAPVDPGDGDRILDFPQFMRRMGTTFPLQGLRKVAVIGSGDSAKCAVKSLLGITPAPYGCRGLDQVQRVDWYANGSLPDNCSDWIASQRSIYRSIGKYLRRTLFVNNETGSAIPSYESALVNGTPYDLAIYCTGQRNGQLGSYLLEIVPGGIARKDADSEYYQAGPICNIRFTPSELDSGIGDISANKVAMFRYAPRTAALAAQLD